MATPPRKNRRKISGTSVRTLGLIEKHSPPRRDFSSTGQHQSEQSLFDNSEMAAPGNLGSPFGVNPKAADYVPGRNKFDSVLMGADSHELNNVIQTYMNSFDHRTFLQNIKYQGFNREDFIREALTRITPHQMLRIALIGAIRGASMEKIAKTSASIDADLEKLRKDGVIVRRAVKSTDITILRCTSAIPNWCAYYMAQAGVTKKISASPCPSWLQFPAAASLPMSAELRNAHVHFSVAFSKLIGGSFNENIYLAMFNNQLEVSEINDSLKSQLGVNTREESLSVDISTILSSALRS